LRQHSRQARYGRFVNQLCRLTPDCYADIPDEVTACRCEEISLGEIRRQLKNGFATMNGLKKASRCGMGNCQGRTCGPILFDMITAFTRRPPAVVGWSSARSPIKTVLLGSLAQMTISNDDDYQNR